MVSFSALLAYFLPIVSFSQCLLNEQMKSSNSLILLMRKIAQFGVITHLFSVTQLFYLLS